MATRIFCDHCGNTITAPNVFCYGPWTEIQRILYAAPNPNGLLGGGGVTPTQMVVTAPASEKLIKIDLCNSCTGIWMERVRNLTKASDADV